MHESKKRLVSISGKETEKGFTLVEFLVVFGIMAIIISFALVMSMETYRGSSFRGDRNTLVAVLERARALSIGNVCIGTCTDGKAHGVHIQAGTYVLFHGNSYVSSDPNNTIFDANTLVTHSAVMDIVFSQLAATTTGAQIVLKSGEHISTTTVSTEGQITWTN